MPHGTLSTFQKALVQSSLAAAPAPVHQSAPELRWSRRPKSVHRHRPGLKQNTLTVSATQPSKNSDGQGPKGKVGELGLKTPDVLHFSDAIGSTGAI